MSGSQYPSDVQFAGLIQAATAAADAQERNTSILGKRSRDHDDAMIDVQLRAPSIGSHQTTGQLPSSTPILQSSASVLFREPSEKSKKYSRPPLGKVYTELELAPESFLRLQNAAKTFMLDEDHMNRRDVVGHKKHSSNNDVAKLRLWECVEEFLNTDENGEHWFGHSTVVNASDVPVRTMFWPEDKQKITKRCMPLFRKMVTNERQRLYAFEARKQSPSKANNKRIAKNTVPDTQAEFIPQGQAAADESSVIDQSLELATVTQALYSANGRTEQDMDNSDLLTLHVNILASSNGSSQRLIPRFSVTSDSVPTLSALIAEVRKKCNIGELSVDMSTSDWFVPAVKVLLPDGLVRIKDDGQWILALLSASMVEWMDSEVRVIIDVGDISIVVTEN